MASHPLASARIAAAQPLEDLTGPDDNRITTSISMDHKAHVDAHRSPLSGPTALASTALLLAGYGATTDRWQDATTSAYLCGIPALITSRKFVTSDNSLCALTAH